MMTSDKILLFTLWYSALMSVLLIYVTHNNSSATKSSQKMSHIYYYKEKPRDVRDIQEGNPMWNKFVTKKPEKIQENLEDFELDSDDEEPHVPGYVGVRDESPLYFKCAQCALVSSSGQLVGKGAGGDIDDAECVIRMNTAPTIGYEEDVGSRTTVRVIGHVNLERGLHNDTDMQKINLQREDTRPEVLIIPWLFSEKINRKTDPIYNIAMNLSKNYKDVDFYFLTSNKMTISEDLFRKETGLSRSTAHTWLTTGWMTMIFAMDVCDRIDVYGLIHEDYCKEHPNETAPYHYYEPDFKRECDYYMWSETQLAKGHKFVTEKAVFARWSRRFNIRFHYPSWKAKIKNETDFVDTPFLKEYYKAKEKGLLEEAYAKEEIRLMKLRGEWPPKEVPVAPPKQNVTVIKSKRRRIRRRKLRVRAGWRRNMTNPEKYIIEDLGEVIETK
ncbi:alpha-N-acetyl-neuraminyl-2,3-beta-galactosyl-1,3-N-acetyl-galactosaminide alpha-2,6-sialyltransferase-like isoform X2 [Anneissia japonica]|uniref:alpha-N-acetyl-neuraminyl-2,3-beta-galactosyl-1, 3-N-acetyl-galactosaminide alpha-2,6-sialyltransferase-like isoform X2 n=1 Tax=Anneissia japonica TaxID=1529436 RepID=UPI001425655F|nr:alpha-N-acetyl-neuraminyl-2,3-beta-galactosyl-1,3-N-acetyl-galactosaminide alpha-2,6-sialyltransferase-like isoform X2 [Anneissia japonica]